MLRTVAATLLLTSALAAPVDVDKRAACPNVHVFGARETTAPAGYGSAGTFVNLILGAYSGSTSEAINYPAAGGTDAAYASSVQAGVQAVANQINAFNAQCPNTNLVYVGYSQGAQIADDAICGGGDPNDGVTSTASPIKAAALAKIKAIIFAGDPRHSPNEPFNYGTSTAGGFDARPAGFSCAPYTKIIRSYCDASDPYCSNGNNEATHQGYGAEYGQNALAFVKTLLPA